MVCSKFRKGNCKNCDNIVSEICFFFCVCLWNYMKPISKVFFLIFCSWTWTWIWEIDYIGYILHYIILSFWIWQIDYTRHILHSIILSFWIWEIDYIRYILHSIIFGYDKLITLDIVCTLLSCLLFCFVFFFFLLLFELLFVCFCGWCVFLCMIIGSLEPWLGVFVYEIWTSSLMIQVQTHYSWISPQRKIGKWESGTCVLQPVFWCSS